MGLRCRLVCGSADKRGRWTGNGTFSDLRRVCRFGAQVDVTCAVWQSAFPCRGGATSARCEPAIRRVRVLQVQSGLVPVSEGIGFRSSETAPRNRWLSGMPSKTGRASIGSHRGLSRPRTCPRSVAGGAMNVGWVRADQENRAGSAQRLGGAGYGCPVKPSAAAHRVTVNEGKAAASSHPRSPPLREQVTMNRGVLDVMRPYGNRGRVLVGRRCRGSHSGIAGMVAVWAISVR